MTQINQMKGMVRHYQQLKKFLRTREELLGRITLRAKIVTKKIKIEESILKKLSQWIRERSYSLSQKMVSIFIIQELSVQISTFSSIFANKE